MYANGVKIFQFQAKEYRINAYPLCLRNTSKDFSVDNMKKSGLNRYVYSFSVDCKNIDISGITEINKYLIKKYSAA